MEVILYYHIPEKAEDDLEMDEPQDELCKGCIKTFEPSEKPEVVHLCEAKLGSHIINGGMPDLDSVIYNIEMMESELKTKCPNCKNVISRDSILLHKCF